MFFCELFLFFSHTSCFTSHAEAPRRGNVCEINPTRAGPGPVLVPSARNGTRGRRSTAGKPMGRTFRECKGESLPDGGGHWTGTRSPMVGRTGTVDRDGGQGLGERPGVGETLGGLLCYPTARKNEEYGLSQDRRMEGGGRGTRGQEESYVSCLGACQCRCNNCNLVIPLK